MCIDYRDLNRACPKDDFPLPKIDILVDSTAGYEMLSFMDERGYKLILLAQEDQHKTAFSSLSRSKLNALSSLNEVCLQ
jgi:hypothetical protein